MAGCVYIWEFRVQPDCVEEFEKHYGPAGSWALLFRQAEGYIETLLLKDATEPLRYVTIDRWRSEGDYRAFRSRFARQYAELDQKCESLTTRESDLGRFIDLRAGSTEHEERFEAFDEFYPFYLSEHANRTSRRLHFVGTSLALALLISAVLTQIWWLLAVALVQGYAFAWVGHFFFEHNKPATFKYPVFSLMGDWCLWWSIVTRKMPF